MYLQKTGNEVKIKIKETFNDLRKILLMLFVLHLVSFPWWSITVLYSKDEKLFNMCGNQKLCHPIA